MPKRKRQRREHTHDWQQIQQYILQPEQKTYELLRPLVLFGETAAERAKEPSTSERTLHHKANRFDQEGMASLFHKQSTPSPDKSRSLPPDMCQLIVNLKAEHPGVRPNEMQRSVFSALVAGPHLTLYSWYSPMDQPPRSRCGAIRLMPRKHRSNCFCLICLHQKK